MQRGAVGSGRKGASLVRRLVPDGIGDGTASHAGSSLGGADGADRLLPAARHQSGGHAGDLTRAMAS